MNRRLLNPRIVAAACASLVTAAGLQVVTISAAAAAAPREVAMFPAELPVNAGLTISQGIVRHIQTDAGGTDYRLFNHSLLQYTDGVPAADGGRLTDPVPCQADVTCVRSVDSHVRGTSYLGHDPGGQVRLFNRVDAATPETSTAAGPATALVDASTDYVLTRSADAQYVIRPGSTGGPLDTVSTRASALWRTVLWTASDGGQLTGKNYAGNPNYFTETFADCPIEELQTTGRFFLWSCGEQGRAEVAGPPNWSFPLPSGRRYLLGDNLVVWHDAATGDLMRYDLTRPLNERPVKLATFTSGTLTDDRNITWAVDKFSGYVAYVDAANTVHVIDPGVPRADPAVGTRTYGPAGAGVTWPGTPDARPLQVTWTLNRPIDSWTFTVTRLAGGATVATRTGGPARTTLSTTWDGLLASGAKAPSGRYTYALVANVAGKSTTISTDTIQVSCGATRLRSYDCTGDSAVLQVLPNGEGHWQVLRDGRIRDNGPTDQWTLAAGTTIVPFGDVNGDGRNDLLVRNGSGVLSAHYGRADNRFTNVADKAVGSGWGGMQQILTSGDLTGDGLADVLAQDAAGVLRRYNGTATGGLANGVVVPGTFHHPKLIGPGDVTGDGRADLYAVTATGALNVYWGVGNGTFGPAEQIGTGWATYTIVSAGDANEDNRNDLIARDAGGVLWLYPGNGTGGFGARKSLGSLSGRLF